MILVAVLPHWRFLLFWATFPSHQHSTLAYQALEGLHELYLGYFWLIYLALLPHILARFVTQMQAGTPYPGSSSVPAITKLSFPADAWS